MSPLKYFHLLRCSLLHATPVRYLLRHLHAVQGLVCPFAKLSSRLTAQLCCAKFCRCCRSLQRMTFAGKSAGRTELRKHSLFKRLSAGTWPYREWAAFVSCFFISTLAHTRNEKANIMVYFWSWPFIVMQIYDYPLFFCTCINRVIAPYYFIV